MNAKLQSKLEALIGQRITGFTGSDRAVTLHTQHGRNVRIDLAPVVEPVDYASMPLIEVTEGEAIELGAVA